eukprot:scaffold1389_cov122-Cylindrotheca_fusiformis.AAC.6
MLMRVQGSCTCTKLLQSSNADAVQHSSIRKEKIVGFRSPADFRSGPLLSFSILIIVLRFRRPSSEIPVAHGSSCFNARCFDIQRGSIENLRSCS